MVRTPGTRQTKTNKNILIFFVWPIRMPPRQPNRKGRPPDIIQRVHVTACAVPLKNIPMATSQIAKSIAATAKAVSLKAEDSGTGSESENEYDRQEKQYYKRLDELAKRVKATAEAASKEMADREQARREEHALYMEKENARYAPIIEGERVKTEEKRAEIFNMLKANKEIYFKTIDGEEYVMNSSFNDLFSIDEEGNMKFIGVFQPDNRREPINYLSEAEEAEHRMHLVESFYSLKLKNIKLV